MRSQRDAGLPGTTFGISKDLAIPEAQHPVTFGLDDCCPAFIGFRRVLSAVNLDYKPFAVAGKVDNEMAQWHLPSPAGLRRALLEQAPHRTLCVGHLPAQLPGTANIERRRMLLHG